MVVPVSVLILTKNEQANIARCISKVSFSDDIVCFDSFSTDATVPIAQAMPGVRVVQREFDNWSTHQNWAVENIEFRYPWVLYLDADEHIDDQLLAEIVEIVGGKSTEQVAFRFRRKDMFMRTWLKHAQLYPTWLVRLFRPENIRWERLVNPVPVVRGETGELRGHIIHYPFSKGVSQWIERHNNYSSFEAEEVLRGGAGGSESLAGLMSKDPTIRRRALKSAFFRMPMRPEIKWLYYMFWRNAWRDGKAGILYAHLQFMYERMIEIKVDELSTPDVETGPT